MQSQNNNDKPSNLINTITKLSAIAFVVIWCFLLLRPFIGIVLWATILAVAFYPIFQWLKNILGGRKNLAAALIAIVSIGIIIGPVGLMAKSLVENLSTLASNIDNGTLMVPPPPDNIEQIPIIGEKINNLWQLASVNLEEAFKLLAPQIRVLGGKLLGVIANVALSMLQFILSIVIAIGFILNGKKINLSLVNFLSRLTPTKGEAFAQLAFSTLSNVIRGVIGIAVIQTLMAGMGMILFGIPSAGILTLICLILTIIQIGPGIIIIGTLIYMWSNVSTLVAVLYTVWMIPTMLIDNFLKPILMARGLPIPMLVIFIGVFGGTLLHGIIGLFIGPVVLGFGYELLQVWMNQDLISSSAENVE